MDKSQKETNFENKSKLKCNKTQSKSTKTGNIKLKIEYQRLKTKL